MNNYVTLTNEQSRQLIDVQQVFDVWRNAARETWNEHNGKYVTSLSWARSNGREYLVQRKLNYKKHIGPRSPETEAKFAEYTAERAAIVERMKTTYARLLHMAPVNRALRLGRMPELTAEILRRFDQHGLLGTRIRVVGTNALYAYENLAGVHIAQPLMETGDAGFLWDARQRLVLRIDKIRRPAVIELLRRVDKSFDASKQYGFAAQNKSGFIVELLGEDSGAIDETGLGDDIAVNPMAGMDALMSLSSFEAIAIDRKGLPYRIVVPDVRVFVLLKDWVSRQSGRPPQKRRRDREQASVLRAIAQSELGLSFEASELRHVPEYLVAQ